MKMSQLKELSVNEILEKLDLSPQFLESFKEWCKDKPSTKGVWGGYSNSSYLPNPLKISAEEEEYANNNY